MRLHRAAIGVAVVLCAGALPYRVAAADAIKDKQQQADALAARIDQLQSTAEQLAEDYNAAQLDLEQAQADVTTAKTKLTEHEAELSGLRSQMSKFALNSYVYADESTGVTTLLDPATLAGEAQGRTGYAAMAMGANVDLTDQLRAQLEDADRERASLEAKQRRLEKLSDAVANKRAGVDKATKAAETALADVKGDLVQLVAEAEQRRQEAAAAAQQAEIQRQQAAAQAAADAAAAAAREAATSSSSSSTTGSRPTSADRSASRTTAGTTRPATTRPARSAPRAAAAPVGPALPVPPPSAGAAGAVRAALSQVGGRYVAFAASPGAGFDCSGLTMWAWGQAGVSLPHYSRAQFASLPHVPLDQLQPGDLVFMGSPIHHVGMYIGNGQMVDAASPRLGVRIAPIHDLVGAARPG